MRDSEPFHFVGADTTWWRWIVFGALYGVALRWLFGAIPHDSRGTMSAAFLIGTPFVLGALAVYGARHRNQSMLSFIFAPWLAVTLMLVGCGIAMLEGSICLAIMSPLFFFFASIGGVTMGLALRVTGRKHSQLKAVAILPFLMIVAEQRIPLQERQLELSDSITINAPREEVWRQILEARAIQPQELPFSITHFIGVPRPIEGVNLMTADGEIRYSTWERGVNFRAIVTGRKEAEFISWRYIFDDKSFPAGSMDEHVAIGGRYFNLNDSTFNLRALPDGRTELEITAHYRISSSINFYAVPAAAFIGHDFISTILGLYKGRSERAAHKAT